MCWTLCDECDGRGGYLEANAWGDCFTYWERCERCNGTGMFYKPFSLDISGEWGRRQALKIIELLRPECDERGIELKLLDVTTIKHSGNRFLIQVYCKRHDHPVIQDSACEKCLATSMNVDKPPSDGFLVIEKSPKIH